MNPFRKLWVFVASQFRQLATWLHLSDPIAVRNRDIEIAAETVTGLTDNLEVLRGKTDGLAERIHELEGDEKLALSRAKRAKEAGDIDAAREFATDVVKIQKKLADIRTSYETANTSYQQSLQSIRSAKDKIVAAKEHVSDQADRLGMAKLDNSIAQISASLNVDPALSLDSSEVDKAIDDQIHTLKAKSQVQKDLQGPASAKDKYLTSESHQAADDLLATL